jgi:hypothetical protein
MRFINKKALGPRKALRYQETLDTQKALHRRAAPAKIKRCATQMRNSLSTGRFLITLITRNSDPDHAGVCGK